MLKKKNRLPELSYTQKENLKFWSEIVSLGLIFAYCINLMINVSHNEGPWEYQKKGQNLVDILENKKDVMVSDTDTISVPIVDMVDFVDLRNFALEMEENGRTIVAKVPDGKVDQIIEHTNAEIEKQDDMMVNPFGLGAITGGKEQNPPALVTLKK